MCSETMLFEYHGKKISMWNIFRFTRISRSARIPIESEAEFSETESETESERNRDGPAKRDSENRNIPMNRNSRKRNRKQNRKVENPVLHRGGRCSTLEFRYG